MGLLSNKIRARVFFAGLALLLVVTALPAFLILELRQDAENAHGKRIKDLVDSARGTVAYYRQMEATGLLTRREAQAWAREALRATRFGEDDYYFIYDFDGRAIMVAGSPQIEGRVMLGQADVHGFKIWDAFVETARGPGSGFIRYSFPRAGETTPLAKLAYVAAVPEWRWIIGTGVYLEDIDREVRRKMAQYVAALLALVLALVVTGIFVARRLLRHLGGETTGIVGLISDIAEFRKSQRQVEYLAYHDRLTDLPNRALLADRMRQAIALARRYNAIVGVCYLDLDGFKPINDQWGHPVGDQVLIAVARRLQDCVRASDTVARLGGDEFVVLLCGLSGQFEVEQAVERMLKVVAEPCEVGSVRAELTMSVGVAIYPDDSAEEPDALIRHADQAMYEAKRSGKNRMRFFDPENDRRSREQFSRHSRLVEALERNEFRLYYQPKVDLRSGAVAGVEALLRWQHPSEGLLLPGQFLPAVEGSDLAQPLGEWVIREALRQRGIWAADGIDLPVSVNLFAAHLQRRDFIDRLRAILAEFPAADPHGLEIEILETTVLNELDTISDCLRASASLGVRWALDDFGTGYSSLTHLRQLPVDVVKIDRSFVRDLLTSRDDQSLVENIARMAHSLGRLVIAEGVETPAHGIPLRRCGCDLAQGYGIARPMPPAALAEWLAAWRMPDEWRESD